jgi:hypothetical protein
MAVVREAHWRTPGRRIHTMLERVRFAAAPVCLGPVSQYLLVWDLDKRAHVHS